VHVIIFGSYADSLLNFRGSLLRALVANGYVVTAIAPAASLDVQRKLAAIGVSYRDIPLNRTGLNPFSDIKTFWSLIFLFREIKPDVTISYTIKPVIYGALASWLAKVPRRFSLVTGLGYTFQSESQLGCIHKLVKWLYTLALSKVDKVFFQNPDDETFFRESGMLGLNIPSCVVNGSGVDLASFPVEPLPNGLPIFLLIARLLGEKGVREYAEASRLIRTTHPNVQCFLVGWLDSNPDTIKQVELDKWIAEGSVIFLGRLADVRATIAASSVYVLPSYREGTPRTVLEAMSMGRAIITTDAPGCRETVVDGENGFLVPIKSSDALLQAMLKFVHNKKLSTSMGSRSRQIAEDKYDVHKVNAMMLQEMGLL
jgi:glycosyltransferase involved in cell wall biosynthesis